MEGAKGKTTDIPAMRAIVILIVRFLSSLKCSRSSISLSSGGSTMLLVLNWLYTFLKCENYPEYPDKCFTNATQTKKNRKGKRGEKRNLKI
jgi:hypothetical protein